MDAAACIGCGACVAACPNAAAMLFAGAKITHLGMLPQGQVERAERVEGMVAAMDKAGFGHCTNAQECVDVCPKEIPFEAIVRMNRDYIKSSLTRADREAV
jgi:succinate dehydrogenase / fumarate reductase iron-sulfur subunit